MLKLNFKIALKALIAINLLLPELSVKAGVHQGDDQSPSEAHLLRLEAKQQTVSLSGLVEQTCPAEADRHAKNSLLATTQILDQICQEDSNEKQETKQIKQICKITNIRLNSIALRPISPSESKLACRDALYDCFSKILQIEAIPESLHNNLKQAINALKGVYSRQGRDVLISALRWSKPFWILALGIGTFTLMTMGLVLSYRFWQTGNNLDATLIPLKAVAERLEKATTPDPKMVKKGFWQKFMSGFISAIADRSKKDK